MPAVVITTVGKSASGANNEISHVMEGFYGNNSDFVVSENC